jgi:hypothetical protein
MRLFLNRSCKYLISNIFKTDEIFTYFDMATRAHKKALVALAREMHSVGIPEEKTQGIMDAICIWRIADLENFQYKHLNNLERQYWQPMIDLRNRHVGGNVSMMYIDPGM